MAVSTKSDKKGAPDARLRLRAQAKYNSLMEQIVDSARKTYPECGFRWVYAPEDRQDYSQIIKRRGMGYLPVEIDEIEEDLLFGQSTGNVRVGDVILMRIDRDLKERYRKELNKMAEEERRRVTRQYYEELRSITAGRHRGTPTGDIAETEEYLEVELPTS